MMLTVEPSSSPLVTMPRTVTVGPATLLVVGARARAAAMVMAVWASGVPRGGTRQQGKQSKFLHKNNKR